jgi:UPF0176 protein
MDKYLVTALYHFVNVDNYQDFQQPILNFCKNHNIKGTLLLAKEGINGTVSGLQSDVGLFHEFIQEEPLFNGSFKNLEHKESWAESNPFYRMKVKLKKEIVTLGVPGISPKKHVGQYVDPKDWNALITDPDTIVIDTRNDYEYDIGTFKNAINPNTKTFREFPDFVKKNLASNKNKKVAMFCTGGIRCEKATSFLLDEGFDEVYHLKGGILKYLENVPQEKSLWDGECFVFDQRVSVKHGLEEGIYDQCFACRHPLSPDEMKSEHYLKGQSCPYCFDKLSLKKKASLNERQKQIELAHARGENHIGREFDQPITNYNDKGAHEDS